LNADIEDKRKTIGVIGIDTRRKTRQPIPGPAPRCRKSRLTMIPMGIQAPRRQGLRRVRAGHKRKR
jgi:hypothetical protein